MAHYLQISFSIGESDLNKTHADTCQPRRWKQAGEDFVVVFPSANLQSTNNQCYLDLMHRHVYYYSLSFSELSLPPLSLQQYICIYNSTMDEKHHLPLTKLHSRWANTVSSTLAHRSRSFKSMNWSIFSMIPSIAMQTVCCCTCYFNVTTETVGLIGEELIKHSTNNSLIVGTECEGG